MDSLLDFTDKVVIITGAASGFGELLSGELASRGAKLVISDINEAGVNKVAEALTAKGYQAIAMTCDVSKEADCKTQVETAVREFGGLDISINNAGIAPAMMSLTETDEATMDLQFQVNVKGVFFGMKYQIPAMKQDGVILNVASMAGLCGAPKVISYAAAKHAVIGMTKTAAVEYARKGIRANAICPYYTLTPMVTGEHSDGSKEVEEIEAFLGPGSPMKRLGRPQEIVNMMLLTLSPGNTYMTGQTIAVDGGVSAF
jgi:NAD(P)-dependent dehydrogenase (short-subunit alcohol dehydrogenase family)